MYVETEGAVQMFFIQMWLSPARRCCLGVCSEQPHVGQRSSPAEDGTSTPQDQYSEDQYSEDQYSED
ncbi:uncharacterized protein V6R79_011191 [Siganus canaliculatus]